MCGYFMKELTIGGELSLHQTSIQIGYYFYLSVNMTPPRAAFLSPMVAFPRDFIPGGNPY
jgi:hypothetical protein